MTRVRRLSDVLNARESFQRVSRGIGKREVIAGGVEFISPSVTRDADWTSTTRAAYGRSVLLLGARVPR
jgi:hypothetical protein